MKCIALSLLSVLFCIAVVADEPVKSPLTRFTQAAIIDSQESNSEGSTSAKVPTGEVKDVAITIQTARGEIDLTVFASKTPVTAANFLNLAKRGYYDGLKFHRVIPDFMIQGGDPLGNGSGGPGYSFLDETRQDLLHDKPGVLSMANSDQNKRAYSNTGKTNGSQFFITHKDTPWLDGKHTVFGQVTKGQNVVDAIKQNDKILKIVIHDDVQPLFEAVKDQVSEWNKILDLAAKKK